MHTHTHTHTHTPIRHRNLSWTSMQNLSTPKPCAAVSGTFKQTSKFTQAYMSQDTFLFFSKVGELPTAHATIIHWHLQAKVNKLPHKHLCPPRMPTPTHPCPHPHMGVHTHTFTPTPNTLPQTHTCSQCELHTLQR